MELIPQVETPSQGIVNQVMPTALHQDLSLVNDVGPGGDLQGLPHVVIRDQNADSFGRQLSDDLLNVGYGNGIDACEGFVQQEKVWLDRQGSGDLRTPPLPSRQGVGLLMPDAVNTEFSQEGFQFFPALLPCEVVPGLQNGHDVVFHRKLSEYRGLLGQIGNPRLGSEEHGELGDIAAVQGNGPGSGGYESHDHIEGGGLSCAVGPQESHHFTVGHGKGYAVHGGFSTEGFYQLIYRQLFF